MTDTRKVNKQILDAASPDFRYPDFSAVNQGIKDLEAIKNNSDILSLEQACAAMSKIAGGSAWQYEMVGQTKGKIGKKKVRPSFELQYAALRFIIQEVYQPLNCLKQEFETLKSELKKEREEKNSRYNQFNINIAGMGLSSEQKSDFKDDTVDHFDESGKLNNPFVQR